MLRPAASARMPSRPKCSTLPTAPSLAPSTFCGLCSGEGCHDRAMLCLGWALRSGIRAGSTGGVSSAVALMCSHQRNGRHLSPVLDAAAASVEAASVGLAASNLCQRRTVRASSKRRRA
jgi:hypothetical protein